jgi:hypothetical protein
MTPQRRELSKREQYVAAWRGFLLMGLMICGWAGYEYYRITDFETNRRLILWWKLFDDLYHWGGKWAVVGFLLSIAAIFFVASGVCLRILWKPPPDEQRPTA